MVSLESVNKKHMDLYLHEQRIYTFNWNYSLCKNNHCLIMSYREKVIAQGMCIAETASSGMVLRVGFCILL